MKTSRSIPLKCQCLNDVKIIITTVSTKDEVKTDSQWKRQLKE